MSDQHSEIREWLAGRGYPPAAVERILTRLDEFDFKAKRDSLFDAIETGEIDIEAIIKDALKEE